MGTLGKRFPTIRQGKALRAGSEGVQIWPEIAPQAGDIVMEKIRQSGFMYTRLEATLKELEVKNILVAGVATGACVECTARDAVARDYSVIVLSDVTSASGLPDLGWGEVDSDTLQRVFLTNFAYHFGKVASTNELLNGPLAITTLKQA
jgi:ureidoacrylate peracid hydrolase